MKTSLKTAGSFFRTSIIGTAFALSVAVCGSGALAQEISSEDEFFAEFELSQSLDIVRSLTILAAHQEESFSQNGSRQSGEISLFEFVASEIDLFSGLQTDIVLDEYFQEIFRVKDSGGKPITLIRCEAEEAGELDCLQGWFTFGARTLRIKGSFPVEKLTGGVSVGLTTAEVDLQMQASNQQVGSETEREIGNRAISLGWEIERTEDGLEIEFDRDFNGPQPGNFNQVDVAKSSFFPATISGSIVIDGVDWMQGMQLQFGVIGMDENEFTVVTGASCGDGVCTSNEFCETCPSDCGACVICGDGICSFPDENAQTCFIDCNFCGDGICFNTSGEDCITCPGDCGSSNGICDLANGDCFNCSVDCTQEECEICVPSCGPF